jgi:hypothetical protein
MDHLSVPIPEFSCSFRALVLTEIKSGKTDAAAGEKASGHAEISFVALPDFRLYWKRDHNK